MNPTLNHYLNAGAGQPDPGTPQATPRQSGYQQMQTRALTPVKCAVCGGDWFFEVNLNQYSNQYSATPGGDLQIISNTNMQVRICPCGQPFRPNVGGVRSGHTGNENVSGLMQALENAIRARSELPAMIQEMASRAVTREELDVQLAGLRQSLEEIAKAVEQFGTAAEPPADGVSVADSAPAARKTSSKKPAEEKK